MAKILLDQLTLLEVIKEWKETPHRIKGHVIKGWSSLFGISPTTLYRKINELVHRPEKQTRSDKGKRKQPEIEKWVWEIMQIKYGIPPGVPKITTRNALRISINEGKVPPEAAKQQLGTINRIAREKGWIPKPQRQERNQAAGPNQVHQFAVSLSKFFYPIRKIDNDWILKLKPIQRKEDKEGEQRPLVIAYALTDDFSGFQLSRYFVGKEETTEDAIEFLKWAWERVAEHAPFCGQPKILFMGKGPLINQESFQQFCSKMGIAILSPSHEPGVPKSIAKAANSFRTMWNSFENQFFHGDWKTREFNLKDLNQKLSIFWEEQNQSQHRIFKKISKKEAWVNPPV